MTRRPQSPKMRLSLATALAAIWTAVLTAATLGAGWWAATLHPGAGLLAAGVIGTGAVLLGIDRWPHAVPDDAPTDDTEPEE